MKYSEYAERFKSICKESDAPKTQKELAKWLDYSQPMINYWINGEKLPSMDTAIKIADKFGVCVEWLMTGKGSKRSNEKPSYPILDKFNQLCPDQKREVTDFINFKLSQKTDKNQLTTPTENVGGGGVNLPVQSQQSQYQRGLTKTRPNQFEIDLAIEHERCVMVRHQEQMEANARYIELVKEACQNNECYCEPPCEKAKPTLLGYMQIIGAVKK